MTTTREFLTVPELAELLRIKERKVYDLAASGLVPCTRATGKLLFPEDEVRAWISTNQTGHRPQRPNVFLGSQDPLLEWALRQSQCGLATYLDGSADGFRRFESGEGIATGLHLRDEHGEGWNTEAVKLKFAHQNVVLLAWCTRARGLVFPTGEKEPPQDMSGIADKRVATRQVNSGTFQLYKRLARECGVHAGGEVGPFHSEQDAVLAVQAGKADIALGLESIADQFGLGFTPVVVERFDLLVDRASFFDPAFQVFMSFCQSEEFQDYAQNLRGYDVSEVGTVVWNA